MLHSFEISLKQHKIQFLEKNILTKNVEQKIFEQKSVSNV